MLTPYQILILLLEIMTPQQIEDAKGPVVRVQSRILKKPSYRSRDLVSLTMLLVEFNLLPFDKLWIRPLLRLSPSKCAAKSLPSRMNLPRCTKWLVS